MSLAGVDDGVMGQRSLGAGPAVLAGRLAPLGSNLGFVQAPLDEVARRLQAWWLELGRTFEVSEPPVSWPDCLLSLQPLQAPSTTDLLAAHGRDWTAIVNNGLDGGDPVGATSVLGQELRVPWVIAKARQMNSVGHATMQFELGGPDGEPPLGYVRSIAAHAEDRRWSWCAQGPVQPFEQPDVYRARRIRDRFTRPMLVSYLRSLGIEVDDNNRFGKTLLFRQIVPWPTRQMTWEQARSEGL